MRPLVSPLTVLLWLGSQHLSRHICRRVRNHVRHFHGRSSNRSATRAFLPCHSILPHLPHRQKQDKRRLLRHMKLLKLLQAEVARKSYLHAPLCPIRRVMTTILSLSVCSHPIDMDCQGACAEIISRHLSISKGLSLLESDGNVHACTMRRKATFEPT
jgi:hypothetical protein